MSTTYGTFWKWRNERAARTAAAQEAQVSIELASRLEAREATANCVICTDDVTLDQLHHGNYGHKYHTHADIDCCKRCMKGHVAARMEMEHWEDVKCMFCEFMLGLEVVKDYISADRIVRYTQYMKASEVRDKAKFRWCTAKGCSAGQVHGGGEEHPHMMCTTCQAESCFNHQTPWHDGKTCAEINEEAKVKVLSEEETASVKEILATTKPCPRCNVAIEKNEGTNRMTCKHCDETFRWNSARKWPKNYQYQDHFVRHVLRREFRNPESPQAWIAPYIAAITMMSLSIARTVHIVLTNHEAIVVAQP